MCFRSGHKCKSFDITHWETFEHSYFGKLEELIDVFFPVQLQGRAPLKFMYSPTLRQIELKFFTLPATQTFDQRQCTGPRVCIYGRLAGLYWCFVCRNRCVESKLAGEMRLHTLFSRCSAPWPALIFSSCKSDSLSVTIRVMRLNAAEIRDLTWLLSETLSDICGLRRATFPIRRTPFVMAMFRVSSFHPVLTLCSEYECNRDE